MQDFRVALIIFRAEVGQIDENLDRMTFWVKQASAAGADGVCFPEMNISGYGIRSVAALNPQPIPGQISDRLARLASRENVAILAGMAERDGEGRVYASHILTTPDGTVGMYRKVHIPPPERLIFSPADRIPIFSVKGVTCGIQLCYDTHFPEMSTWMALQGVDVVLMPHASPFGTPEEKYLSWIRHLPARAFDNGIFVLACNQTGDNGQGLSFPGLALAIGPDGRVLKKDISGAEGMMLILLKSETLAAVRNHRMRYFLKNRRPELYSLHDKEKKG